MSAQSRENSAIDYDIRVFDDPAEIEARQWNALLALQPSATPFMRHEYLLALHASGSASPQAGWTSQFITIFANEAGEGRLVAAAPLYLKDHSYGEYVFDWAWADAYQRHGLAYYPKLLCAVPFTPVPGPRLLARDDDLRARLLQVMQQLAFDAGLSSAHVLFLDEADQRAAREAGWMLRSTVQFHWNNREVAPYADFADFLASLQRDKRRKITQERRKVAEAGVGFIARVGREITPGDWDFFYRCYTLTYHAHRSTPYLTRDFFARVADAMSEHWLLFIAQRNGRRIAASLIALDPQRGNAFGRYWGATEPVDCLHFEACYYQPLAWCIANGYRRFEGGAQGEHKMARGLLPVATASAHWLAHPQFAQAVAEFLLREGRAVDAYMGELEERRPFKTAPAGP
jgi:uncharacterized protein